jgi:tetratricopeptide (TPR) repeat protein/ketosteroid isomerase-like protein
MSFFNFLQWRSAPVEPNRWSRWGGQTALGLGICMSSMAQTPPPSTSLDAIKKALQTGQLDQAQKLVAQARDSAPKEVQWQFMEGVIQAQQGQTDKAIETFRKITEKYPDQSEAFNNLGVLYASKGRLEESRAYLEKALLTHPSYAAAHRNLSDVLSQLAKDSYGKALQVDPKARISTPQLTLLGSIAPDPRLASPSQSQQSTAAIAQAQVPAAKTANPVERPIPQASSAASQTPGNAPKVPSAAVSAAPSSTAAAKAPVPPATTSSVATSAPSAKPGLETVATASAASSPAAAVVKPTATPPTASNGPAQRAPATAVATPLPAAASAAVANAPKVPGAATPTAPTAEQQAIQTAIAAWAKAWSKKDMSGYFAAYTRSFTTSNMSRSQWEADRQLKILSKRTITVGINQLQITVNGDKAVVRFQQVYASDNFKGSSRKTLELSKQGERWLITREFVN